MIGGLLLFGASYNVKYVKHICYITLIAYTIATTSWEYGVLFPLINFAVLFTIPMLIRLFKIKIANSTLAVVSKLIYSVVIDIICYAMYPSMTMGQNIFQYVWSGLVFNYRGILLPALISSSIVIVKEVTCAVYKRKIAYNTI